jgi:hypothetical protein
MTGRRSDCCLGNGERIRKLRSSKGKRGFVPAVLEAKRQRATGLVRLLPQFAAGALSLVSMLAPVPQGGTLARKVPLGRGGVMDPEAPIDDGRGARGRRYLPTFTG